MTRARTTATAIAALCLFSSQAFGLTAEEVWDKYETLLRTDADTPVTIASRTKVGDTLSINGLAVDYADDDVSVAYTIDVITLTEQSDGSVRIETAETIPFDLTFQDGDTPVSMQLEYTQKDAVVTVSGTVDRMNFDSQTPEASVTLGELKGAEDFSDSEFTLTLRDMVITSNVDAANMQDASFKAAAIAFDFAMRDPATTDGFEGTMIANNLAGSFKGNADALAKLGTSDGPLPDLFLEYGFDDISGQMNFDIEDEKFDAVYAAGSSKVTYDANAQFISGVSEVTDMSMKFNIATLPVPIDVSMGSLGGGAVFPTAKDTRSPVEYGFYLRDLKLNDGLWSLFDAAGVFPRDPITLELKLTGDAELGFDLLTTDPEDWEELENPGKIYGLNLDTLLVQAVGAKLTGSGAFTFDNDDLETLDGFPRPMGSALFNLVGANALLDKLPQTGLIKAEDLLPVRMMMGMFTQPGDGEDSLKTEVEVNEQFHVLVNGVRMQ